MNRREAAALLNHSSVAESSRLYAPIDVGHQADDAATGEGRGVDNLRAIASALGWPGIRSVVRTYASEGGAE
ncbi:hypothetical protein [Streptomyces sp. WM6378]|uniref:hypothetical protein n=1 Tax=Streptomyces sp. WM6378 TaxID=1415557 RepID=UPI0006AF9DFE|nr:hypothetical protein [Streptomyces sp. WM6378]KOU46867.1 hypothetical protein ADK54_14045 [Streptomyces sp. WM6378]